MLNTLLEKIVNILKKSTLVELGVMISFLLLTSQAHAIPAFAKENSTACSTCHTAVPTLSKLGRDFKTNGYRFASDQKPAKQLSENLSFNELFPVSLGLVGRPYDEKDSGESKNRALHEVELFIAGAVGDDMSAFAEFEGEDEESFEVGLKAAQFTYSHSKQVNLQLSYASVLYNDPYDTYADMRRMTRGHNVVVDKASGGADGNIRGSRQNATIFGRIGEPIYYSLSWSGPSDDAEGTDANLLTARGAFDITPDVMVGGMYMSGTCTVESGSAACAALERDYSRYGLDFQADITDLRLTGAFVAATDDDAATPSTEIDTDTYYLQAMYTFEDNGRPTWVPVVRFDNYDKNGGVENIDETTLQLNYFFKENVKGMIELWDRAGDGATADDDRITVQFYAYF